MNHATHIRDAVLRHFLATGEEATVKDIVTRLQEIGHPLSASTVRKAINASAGGSVDGTCYSPTYQQVFSRDYPGMLLRAQKVPAWEPTKTYLRALIIMGMPTAMEKGD